MASIIKLGIVGLGLIGGSMAKALSKLSNTVIYGYDCDLDTLEDAIGEESVNFILNDETLPFCDVIFLALYPKDALEYAERWADRISQKAVVCDLCGIKSWIYDGMTALAAKYGFDYIGGHPMAGIERSGYKNSSAELFKGASMILCPSPAAKQQSVTALTDICHDIGFSRITLSDPETHDKIIAYTSQLAHIVSSAYVRSPIALDHNGYSAGSFKDLTRVARLNPTMWTELFSENRGYLKSELDLLIDRLREYSDALASDDKDRLWQLLSDGNEIKIRSEETESSEIGKVTKNLNCREENDLSKHQ